MKTERAPEFSQEENEAMGALAIEIANWGEEDINTLIGRRHWLMVTTINIYQANIYRPASLDFLAKMEHEVAVIDEVIKRARAILKMEGRDLESEGKRLFLAASFGYVGDTE